MNIDKFGRMSFELHKKGGHSSSALGGVSVSNEALDVQNRKVMNVAGPNDPTDGVNKAYVDKAAFALQEEIKSLKKHVAGFDQHIFDMYRRETLYLKLQDWDELFKEEILDEKNKLINSLLDLLSGKIKRPSQIESTDGEKLNKTELLAVLEAWRGK